MTLLQMDEVTIKAIEDDETEVASPRNAGKARFWPLTYPTVCRMGGSGTPLAEPVAGLGAGECIYKPLFGHIRNMGLHF
ncbi:MAG: hypothetical protein QF619_11245, partial [Candidatus Binatia bacterium]|nr:hypothetical protein [Candidatus Binatia bacterium]